jgi:hypothetical protein
MSEKSRAGKAVWATRAATYPEDLANQIAADSKARMGTWSERGRIPIRVRLMARLTGRPVRLPPGQTLR